jgi:hypothetical protein
MQHQPHVRSQQGAREEREEAREDDHGDGEAVEGRRGLRLETGEGEGGEDEDGEGVEGRMKEEEDKEFVVLGADAGADPGAVAGGFGREQREGWEGKRRGDEGEWSE